MPSTFSTSLRLELMGAGEQAGNWNNTTNVNLGTLLEQAITGVASISMTDANLTLSAGNGVSDQARNAVLVVGGALTANRNLIVPSVNKFYAVNNATTGGFSIVVKTASGSGVTLANGFTQLMYCDGTNVVLASVPINSTNGNVAVSGDMSVTGTVSSGGGVVMPTGAMLEYGGATAPAGWLLCDGAAVSRTTYAALYAVLGNTYGAGDGSTTFNVPDRRDRVGVGAGSTYARGATGGAATATTSLNGLHSHGASGTTEFTALTVAQMPAHQHTGTTDGAGIHNHALPLSAIAAGGGNPGFSAGNLYEPTGPINNTENNGLHSHNFTTNYQGSGEGHLHAISPNGEHSHTVSTLQPYVASNYIIKA